MKFFIIAGALLLGGCGFQRAEELRISEDFEPEQQEALIEAAEDWFASVPGSRIPIAITPDDEANVSPRLVDDMHEHCSSGAGAATRLHTFKRPHLSPCPGYNFSGTEFRRAMAHEIGHALTGTDDHLEEVGHIMTLELYDTSERVTDKDVTFFVQRL